MFNQRGMRCKLSSVGFTSLYSYELTGDHIVGRLFGLIPAQRIHLGAVVYLRLASYSDLTPLYSLFNWLNFLPHRRCISPVYILQTRSRHRIFLKMDSAAHFRLRQAIGRYSNRNTRLAA